VRHDQQLLDLPAEPAELGREGSAQIVVHRDLPVREPGGARVEINTGGYRLYVPDWETTRWIPSQGSLTFYRNVSMPQSMMEGSPPAAEVDEDAVNPWSAASVH